MLLHDPADDRESGAESPPRADAGAHGIRSVLDGDTRAAGVDDHRPLGDCGTQTARPPGGSWATVDYSTPHHSAMNSAMDFVIRRTEARSTRSS